MTLPPKNLPPWSQLSFVLAKQVLKLDIPKTFLTVTELESLNQALISFDTWEKFISDNNLTAFRVRAMLSEQFIHNGQRPCCQALNLDLAELCKEANHIEASSPTPMSNIPLPINKEEETHVPLLDIYHTLEFDMAAMMEQRKLDNDQVQEQEQNHAASTAATTISIMEDTDNFNLKYLLKGITENRSKTTLSDRELRNLLLDVKPHRSKCANDGKVGQEDLYEACEKVLTDLKNYTEHSTPFLSKVNKRDAPDYFDVIKEPIDLGTVSKKLKHFQYKNKKEFGNDLYLIYENCLIYNTNPTSEYRKHAIAMRRKTDRLLTRVPEIVMKERVSDMDESDEENHTKRSSTRERSMTHESTEEVFLQHPHHRYSGKHPQKSTTKALDEIVVDHPIQEESDTDKGELQNQIWRDITKKTRGKLTIDIEKQYQFEFGNRQVIQRTSFDMDRFSMLEHLHHEPESTKKLMRCSQTAFIRWMMERQVSVYDTFDLSSDEEEDDGGGFFFSRKGDNHQPKEDATRTDLFLPEYSMAAGLPEIDGIPEEYIPIEEEDVDEVIVVPSLDIFPTTQLNPHGLFDIMDGNIQTLQHIRSMYSKCNSIRRDTLTTAVDTTTMHDADLLSPTGTPIPTCLPQQQPITQPPSLCIDPESSHQMIQRTLTQILTHAGFEGAQSNALNILTELMSDYFSNIGKTARRYWDEHGRAMSGQDILYHTLNENGVHDVNDLNTYVTEDIEHYGNKLLDINRKLSSTFQDLIAGSIEDTGQDESNIDDEAFVTGVFGQDVLDQDFFGFKELGLDQEFNMKSLNVPSKLWFGKTVKIANTKKQQEPLQLKYPVPPPFIPATSTTPCIGLLKPWYEKRLVEQPIEDEYMISKRRRLRYPPVHIRSACPSQQQSMKSRVLKDGSNTMVANEEAKRKRKQVLEESKAQKKKQKLELKVQKLAEKDQKKKLREEEKLAKKKAPQ